MHDVAMNSIGFARWQSRVTKGVLAIVDQGLISGSNFMVGILLARWLPAEQYGAYAVAFATFILLSQFYQSLLLEPMSVFGGSHYRHCHRDYIGILLYYHCGIALLIFLGMGVVATGVLVVGGSKALAVGLAATGAAAPFVLLFWLVRRAFYLNLSPSNATLGAGLYSLVVGCGIVLLNHFNMLSVATAFFLMGAAALLTSVMLLMRVGPVVRLGGNSLDLKQTWARHWQYGKWAVGSSIAIWVPSNVYYGLVSSFAGLGEAADLRALLNFALPVGQTATALALLFQTYTSRVCHEKGSSAARELAPRITMLYAAGAIVYWTAIVTFRHAIVNGLYGGRYAHITWLIPWLAITSIVQVATAGLVIGLRALESPSSVFAAYLISTAITLLVGIPATKFFGVTGCIFSMLAASCAAFVAALTLLRRWRPAVAVV